MRDIKPHITVITVVYNGDAFLEETIKNVINLPYENLSYVIIDGGSTDKSVNIIKKYQDKISYWISEKDQGIYDAMNKGWNAAADDSFILFLGAGDRILSLPKNMENFFDADVVYGNVHIGEDNYFISKLSFLLMFFNTLHHQALLIRKSIHKRNPFDIKFKLYADFDFNQRLWKHGVKFARSEDFISYALPNGISYKYSIWESLRVVVKNFGIFFGLIYFPLLAVARLLQFISKKRASISF